MFKTSKWFIVCALAFVCFHCSAPQSPEDVVVKFFQLALQKKDGEAVKLLTKDLEQGLNNNPSATEALINSLTENRAQFDFQDVQMLEEEATVGGNLTLNDEQKSVVKKSIKLTLEDGIWKINNH